MANDSAIRQQISQVVRDTDKSAKVILFGSHARGTAHADSDWDVLILIDKPTVSIKEEQVFRHRLYDLELKIKEPISTFVYSMQDWNSRLSGTPLYQNVAREGIPM